MFRQGLRCLMKCNELLRANFEGRFAVDSVVRLFLICNYHPGLHKMPFRQLALNLFGLFWYQTREWSSFPFFPQELFSSAENFYLFDFSLFTYLFIYFFGDSFIVWKVTFVRSSCYQRRGLIDSSRNLPARAEEKKSQDSGNNAFKKSSKQGPVTWVSLALVALAGGGLVFYVRHLKEEKEQGDTKISMQMAVLLDFFICYVVLRLPLKLEY